MLVVLQGVKVKCVLLRDLPSNENGIKKGWLEKARDRVVTLIIFKLDKGHEKELTTVWYSYDWTTKCSFSKSQKKYNPDYIYNIQSEFFLDFISCLYIYIDGELFPSSSKWFGRVRLSLSSSKQVTLPFRRWFFFRQRLGHLGARSVSFNPFRPRLDRELDPFRSMAQSEAWSKSIQIGLVRSLVGQSIHEVICLPVSAAFWGDLEDERHAVDI